MKLAANPFTHALGAGDKQVGLWISLCSNFVAEVTAHAGYDWALIDMEHSPNDYFSVLSQMQAFAASDTTAIVRGATKFGRVTDYVARIEEETTVLLQLETRAAVEQAEAIADVDGIHGIFFGPGDIAADIGKVGKPMDPEVWALIKPAVQKLIAKGIPVGTLVLDPAFATELLNEGFTFVACGTDASLLAKASDHLLATVKGGLT